MLWTNYHSHSDFSDGKGTPEEYVLSAIKYKMYAYGFSCHSPVPFNSGWNMKFEKLFSYISEIKRLKIKYENKLKIYLGLEIDYFKNLSGFHQYKKVGLDYSIGGIHFLGFFNDGTPWDFDSSIDWFEKGLNELFSGDIKNLVSFYYQQIEEMIANERTDIIAHLDLIKKYNEGNTYFDENAKWYRDIVFGLLEKIAKSGSILEVNTRGVLKKLNMEFYPSNFILKRCMELKIPVILSSDAHQSKDVMALLPEACKMLASIGYKEAFILDEKGWRAVPIC
jgi:histidinol-phosphatase (PHP family)